MDEDLLSVAEAAALLGLRESQTRTLARKGELPARQVGRAYVIQRRVVEEFLRQRREQSDRKRGRGRPAKLPPAGGSE